MLRISEIRKRYLILQADFVKIFYGNHLVKEWVLVNDKGLENSGFDHKNLKDKKGLQL